MNEMVLAAFMDELSKIAAENAAVADPSGVKPAPIPSLSKNVSPATKPQTKASTYTSPNTQAPMAAYGASSAPPPPVHM